MKPFIFRERALRRVQNTIASFALTNILLMIATFSFMGTGSPSPSWASSRVVLVMQVVLNAAIVIFWSFKSSLQKTHLWVIASAISVVLLILFSAMVYQGLLQGDTRIFMMWFIEGVHILLAFLIIFEAFFAWHTDFSLPDYHVHSENNDVRPTGVYLYQPRIDQSLVNRRPDEEELEAPATIATPAPVPVNESRIRQQLRWFFDANESQERMDELPRYQRQTPVSSAVIIDMANLDNDIADADALPESETRNWELPEMPEQAATGSTREAAWTRTHDHSADSHHSRLSPSATTTTTTTTTMTLTGTVSGTLPTTEPPSYTP